MKSKALFSSLIIIFLLSSCASKTFFQVYKAVPIDKLVVKNNYLIYEDDNCIVSYNFWTQGGDIGFQFYNKSTNNIYVNLEESFFVLNGNSFNYFRNRVFTNTKNSSASISQNYSLSQSATGVNYLDLLQTNKVEKEKSAGLISSSGFSISYNEEKIICIPPKTSKYIGEYHITESLFRDCELYKYPTKKEIKTKTFSKAESPIIFSNIISYSTNKSEIFIRFKNEFYISEITNYPENEIIELKVDEFCGEKGIEKRKYFKNNSSDSFYIEYKKGKDFTFKH